MIDRYQYLNIKIDAIIHSIESIKPFAKET